MSIDAMKQALEALDWAADYGIAEAFANQWGGKA